MQSNLRRQRIGLDISIILVAIYTVITLTGQTMVSLLTTGSWQAAYLDISWSTIAGFEIGLLVVIGFSFGISIIITPILNFLLLPVIHRSKTLSHFVLPAVTHASAWRVRMLASSLVLPAIVLVVLHTVALVSSYVQPNRAVNSRTPGSSALPVNLSSTINTAYREAEPSFTADGLTMYFNCDNGDICVSHQISSWEEGKWTPPERLDAPINTAYEEIEPVINSSGDKLYFSSVRPGGRLNSISFLSPFINVIRVANTMVTSRGGRSLFGGLGLSDVYVSYWIDGAWSEPHSLNDVPGEPSINTSFADHCLFFSADGNEAFWTSTRPGGFGDNDIWTSRRINGVWTQPENLGPSVNSPGSEHTSIPTPDGLSLYVTANRPNGFGGDDNYITTRNVDGQWEPLVNLGPLVNGPGDDRCPAWTPDLQFFLFDSVRRSGFGARDIWWVNFRDVPGYPQIPRTAVDTHQSKIGVFGDLSK